MSIEAASGIVLLAAAAIALTFANSRWSEAYAEFWALPLGLRVGAFRFERPLVWFVNDVAMVVFFFVVGLEIRRELHQGELSAWRRAVLPVTAALGGMLAPAGFYLLVADAAPTRAGWGVPMATDIAFAVGILTLLGKRVPAALRVLLLALAVIDDLGAILVIALFYSSGIALSGLFVMGFGLGGIALLQRLAVRAKLAYVLPAAVAWAGVYGAGVHPTIAGVIVGLMTPVRAWLGAEGFADDVRHELSRLEHHRTAPLSSHALAATLARVDRARREAMAPADSLIEALHPWVAFGIMPLFALANAGVRVDRGALDADALQVIGGTLAGLVLGKPAGIVLAVILTVKSGLGVLPRGLGTRHVLVLGVVAGIGFTMALFIAQLAFRDAALLSAAKLGVLAASGLAALAALGLGSTLRASAPAERGAVGGDEAESSTAL